MIDGFGNMGVFGGFGMLLGALFWVGVVALLVWGAYAIFPASRDNSSRGTENAIDILKRRYAAGEITQAEFEQAMKAIS